jgi:hypothetical protein
MSIMQKFYNQISSADQAQDSDWKSLVQLSHESLERILAFAAGLGWDWWASD